MNDELFGYARGPSRFEIEGFTFHAATRVADQRACLLKVSQEYSLADARALEHESSVLSGRELRCALRPFELANASRVTLLAFEYFAGLPLLTSRGTSPWPQSDALRVARALCLALQECHERGVVHCRLSPTAVLEDAKTGAIRIAHFPFARASACSDRPVVPPLGPYSAPEQSGRVTLDEGEWTDLYALGCMLYRLVSGRLPLGPTDSVAFPHRLVTEVPPPLSKLVPAVSPGLSALVERLMAKSPHDRPRSVTDVGAELEDLDRHPGRTAPANTGRPQIHCNGVYGRNEELELLLRLAQESQTGTTRIVWLSGGAGLGKSRLLTAFRQASRRSPALFALGKFDQYRHDRPYSALLQAIHGIIAQFLSATDPQVQRWADAFLAVDESLRAIWLQQLPIFRHLIGEHAEPLPLGRVEAANRFTSAMSALMDVLCTAEHPLILCIDDFQWVDDASADFLQALMDDERRQHLLLTLAFRAQALTPGSRSHALHQAAVERGGPHIFIKLNPLHEQDLDSLCTEAVQPCTNARLLAELVRTHAKGNPFVALEILRQLERTGLLTWGGVAGRSWRLEPGAPAHFKLPESSIDFLIERLHGFSPVCQHVLGAAGSIGHDFRVRELVLALEMPALQVADALAEARDGQWIAPLDDTREPTERTFRFTHDRMQQAAVALCSADQRTTWYRVLGHSLMQAAGQDRETVFRAADYFSEIEVEGDDERKSVARLFRAAGEFARDDVAYAKAVALFSRALDLLASQPDSRTESFDCQLQHGESLYLNGDFEQADAALAHAAKLAENRDQDIKVQKTRFSLLLRKQAYEEAITFGVGVLRGLQYRLPRRPSIVGLVVSILVLRFALKRYTVRALQARPDRSTGAERDILAILILLSTPAYWANERLSVLIGLRLLRATLRKGNVPQSPMAYANWCILSQVLFREPARALEYGRLAEALLGPDSDPIVISRVRFVVPTFVGTLMRSNRNNVATYERAFFECVRHGEHVFAGHCIDGLTVSLPLGDFTLSEIEAELARWEPRAARVGSEATIELLAVARLWCREQTGSPAQPGDEELAAQLDGKSDRKLKNLASLSLHRMLSVVSSYLLGEHEQARLLAKAVEQDRRFLGSNPLLGAFVSVLIVLSSCRTQHASRARGIGKHIKRLRQLAAIFPANFRQLLLLAEGEWAFSRGNATDALRLLKEAVAEAIEQGNHLVHALACECLAAHYEQLGDPAQHRDFVVTAGYSFSRWGARSKVRRMTDMNPGIVVSRERLATDGAGGTDGGEARWGAVMRSIDAVAEVRDMKSLALRLLQIITTTAGARRSALLREVDGHWCVLAAINAEGSGFRPGEGLTQSRVVPRSLLRYALRTQLPLQLQRPAEDPRFEADEYFAISKPRAAVCLPVLHRGQTSVLVYLENSLTGDVFTEDQMTMVNVIGRQAAVSLETSDYHKLQLDAVQSRINPHFLYNTLSTIAELVVKEPLGAESALVVLARLYRYMLGSSWDQMVSLKQELDITRDYLAIEKHRFGARLDSQIEIVGPIDDVQVPALLLQPIVENAVRHGIAKKARPGKIQIYVIRDQRVCKVRIADDGPGPEPGAPAEGRGFGLRSVTRRLELLYGTECSISSSTDRGFAIELQFPVRPSVN